MPITAALHTARALALLFAAHPELSAQAAREPLLATARCNADLDGLVQGGRALDAGSLLAAPPPAVMPEWAGTAPIF